MVMIFVISLIINSVYNKIKKSDNQLVEYIQMDRATDSIIMLKTIEIDHLNKVVYLQDSLISLKIKRVTKQEEYLLSQFQMNDSIKKHYENEVLILKLNLAENTNSHLYFQRKISE